MSAVRFFKYTDLVLYGIGVFFYERYLRAFSAENFEIFTVTLKLKDGSLPATQRIVVESNIDDSESKLDFLIPLKNTHVISPCEK